MPWAVSYTMRLWRVFKFLRGAFLILALTISYQALARPPFFSRANASEMPLVNVNYFSADGSDPLKPQTQEGKAGRIFLPIGTLETNLPVPIEMPDGGVVQGRTRATAFLISPCYIMTNYHAVYGELHTAPDRAANHSATFNVDGRKINAKPAAYGEYYKDWASDWAVFHLDQCIGEEIGWLNLMSTNLYALYNYSLSVAGYPADHLASTLWVQNGCQIHSHIDSTIAFRADCASSPGMSGGPIFIQKNQQLCVLAISEGSFSPTWQKIFRSYNEVYANIIVGVREIEDEEAGVKIITDRDINRFGQPNPAFTTTGNQCLN